MTKCFDATKYVFPNIIWRFRKILVAFSENMNFTNPSLSSILRNKFCLLTHTIDSPLRISYNSWISQILSCSVWHVITISFSLFSYFPRNFRHLTPFPDAWRVTREERISSYYIRLLPRYKTDCLLAITFSFIHLLHGKWTFMT